jgi:hypothetical protein
MASLTGNLISDSYAGLLKTIDNAALSTTLKNITDGNGNASALFTSTEEAGVSGSLYVSGTVEITYNGHNTVNLLTDEYINVSNVNGTIGSYLDMHGLELLSGSNFIDITVDGITFGDEYSGSVITVANASGTPAPVIALQNHDNYTDGTVSILTPLEAKTGIHATGSVIVSGSLKFATSSSFVLPVVRPAAPVAGTAYFSGSFLYIYNGSAFVSASFS